MGVIQKLKKKIFNDYSSFGYDYFIDKKGRKIWFYLEDESLNQLLLFHKGNIIGKMLFSFEDEFIELCDIVVFEDRPLYRKSGIGSWMFNKLKDIAKEHNYKFIIGNMVPEKSESLQDLVKFYEKQGCEIEDGWFKFHL